MNINKINLTVLSTLFLDLSSKPHMIEIGLLGCLQCLCQTHFLALGLQFLIHKWI